MRRAWLPAVLSLVVVAPGCGGDDNEDATDNEDRFRDVASLVDDFAQAGREGDGERICDDLLLPTLTRNIEGEAGQSCASEVEQRLPKDEYELQAIDIKISGEAATVAVVDQAKQDAVLHLVQRDGEWRVARVSPAF